LVTAFDAGLPLVPCLADEFNQVMLNFIVNSAHAIGRTTNLIPAVHRAVAAAL
jgi:nitrogen-specific signal transduction histidine kinase